MLAALALVTAQSTPTPLPSTFSLTGTTTKCTGRGGEARNELRWDVFNVFNTVNYALPQNVSRPCFLDRPSSANMRTPG